ncbi:MAG: sulfurtransferase, partial [Pelagibacterales bacterium]|nr:sulfurtransferase [Pelagibacterales bacterium]
GCIPESKNIPFQDCIDPASNTLKKKSELIKIFKENNIDYYKPTVFMCGAGFTACVLGLVYFLISDRSAVIYDGSFAEWGKK